MWRDANTLKEVLMANARKIAPAGARTRRNDGGGALAFPQYPNAWLTTDLSSCRGFDVGLNGRPGDPRDPFTESINIYSTQTVKIQRIRNPGSRTSRYRLRMEFAA
jgi:hypothetical protein